MGHTIAEGCSPVSMNEDVLPALRERLSAVESRLTQLERPNSERPADAIDAAIAIENRDQLIQARARLVDEARRIRAVIARAEAGAVLACIGCDEPIPVGRLRAVPSAERCVPCQARHEHEARNGGGEEE